MVRRPAGRAGATAEQTRPVMSRSVADPLLIQQAGAVIELVLNRPDKANALDAGLVEALLVAVARAANSGARLLTLRGEGRHFCAGFDFSDLDQQSDGDLLHRFVRIEQLLQALHHAPLTTLALCHGSALGAGADLVAALVGADAAHEILVTSRSFEAAEAERFGFVQRLAEPGTWPEIVRGIVDAQRLDGIATMRLKARVKPDMRACDMAALVDSAATPGLKDRIRAFRSAEN